MAGHLYEKKPVAGPCSCSAAGPHFTYYGSIIATSVLAVSASAAASEKLTVPSSTTMSFAKSSPAIKAVFANRSNLQPEPHASAPLTAITHYTNHPLTIMVEATLCVGRFSDTACTSRKSTALDKKTGRSSSIAFSGTPCKLGELENQLKGAGALLSTRPSFLEHERYYP